jgi:dihydrofolate reductase
MNLSLIVAVSQNGVIGRAGGLPWHLPEDLRHFKRLTMGHHIIMGRATFESLGRCLPGRTNVVVTSSDRFADSGAVIVRSFSEAVEIAASDSEPFVIGGARIFEAARPLVDRIYLTRVLIDVEGDTFWDLARWGLSDPTAWGLRESSAVQHSAAGGTPFQFQTWERVPAVRLSRAAARGVGEADNR